MFPRLLSSIVLFATTTTPALCAALSLPPAFPVHPVSCVHEGVFPGSGMIGKWRVDTGEPRTWSVQPDSPDQLRGIVQRYAGDRTDYVVSEGVMLGKETTSGAIMHTEERLQVSVRAADGSPGTLIESVRRETACPGFPREVAVGDRWTCQESTTFAWETSGALVEPSGQTATRRSIAYHYVKNEVVAGQTLAVIEALGDSAEDGFHERTWLDPAQPWCPSKVERLKIGHVVGTDVLLAVMPKAEVVLKGRDQGDLTLPGFALVLLAIGGSVLAFGFGVSWLAGRRQRRNG